MCPIYRVGPVLLVLLILGPPAHADEVAWSPSLKVALERSKEQQKIIMVCINAKKVEGRETDEPAAKGLREVVYKNGRIVDRSRDFICVLLSRKSGSVAHGLLRNIGVGGDIVSPQHIFIHPDGDRILLRKEYWSHGKGEPAVKALLGLMAEAEKRFAEPTPPKADPGTAEDVGKPGADRAAWIAKMIDQVVNGEWAKRDAALRGLIKNDKDGDCITPLVALFDEHKKNTTLLVDLTRTLGRDGLTAAALPISGLLKRKEEVLRGNAAVSLEYIGSRDKKVVATLMKAAGKEKDEMLANHMYRALGRCGVENGNARALLLKKSEQARSEFASYGPIIGLAYFEGDKKAIRPIEKILKRIGIPGGRRGGGQNAIKRGVVSWTLATIGNEQSGKFVREELIKPLGNMKAWWVGPVRGFYESVAKKCEGDEGAMAAIEGGIRRIVQFASGGGPGGRGGGGGGGEAPSLMDEYRKNRNAGSFTPKGDELLGSGDE